LSVEPSRLEPVRGVMGYVDRPSAAPGERLALHVSCDDGERWTADLVRVLAPDLLPGGPEPREEPVAAVPAAERPALVQPTVTGSYVLVPGDQRLPSSGPCSVAVIACPALPGGRFQALVSRRTEAGAGWLLGIDATGAAAFRVGTEGGDEAVSTDVPLLPWCWYVVAGSLDPAAGVLRVVQAPVGTPAANRFRRTGAGLAPSTGETRAGPPLSVDGATPVLLAAGLLRPDRLAEPYEGKLERPVLTSTALAADELARLPLEPDRASVAAAWDLAPTGSDGFTSRTVRDCGPHGLDGTCHQHPTRGVTGHNWDSTQLDFRHAPEQYAAAHFHSDDLTDCRWEPQLELRLPDGLPSGVYAVRLRAAASEDRVPFIVRPTAGAPVSPILLVLSTNSYLAYANQAYDLESPRFQMISRRVPQIDPGRRLQAEHRDLGASLYDIHPDATGVCYSSWRRPILTMRPSVRLANAPAWQFNADLQIVDWLDRTGRAFDVVCDRDVHDGGAELLARHRVVLTGTHPEYPTGRMLDALDEYVAGGGRLVYMGGNGFYWVTAYDPEDPQVIEIRRHGGTEAWRALPGEGHLSFTGEPGGLWRSRGRAPQKLTGIGFVAQGYEAAAGYRRNADLDPRAAWVLDGVTEEYFGHFGTMGGAAGLELDIVDPALGTPPQTILLASSEGHSDDMLEARENYGMTLAAPGGARNPRVRADMTLLPLGAGAVFSTGSIAFAGSLAHNGYDNAIARILANVIDRFASSQPVLDE
jgi:N,N-dimethylformamidase